MNSFKDFVPYIISKCLFIPQKIHGIDFLFFNRSTLIGRDFLTLRDFNETEVKDLLSTAADLKKKVLEENRLTPLAHLIVFF